ncbi:MAG: hypothetical protein JXX14_19320 [Deltaproteobacteria bacterium]|nr:hypothetical protein [Deltaproteobacteria bacterium]
MAVLDKKETCERLARAVCMDIESYQQTCIQQYRQGGPMPAQLVEAIEEGRALYLSRVAASYADLFDKTLTSFLGIDVDAVLEKPSSQQGWAPVSEWGKKAAASSSSGHVKPNPLPAATLRAAPPALPAVSRIRVDADGEYTRRATTEYDRRDINVDKFNLPKGLVLLIVAVIVVLVVYFGLIDM